MDIDAADLIAITRLQNAMQEDLRKYRFEVLILLHLPSFNCSPRLL